MAYSELEGNRSKNSKYQQYYPFESDYPEYYYAESKQNYIPYRNPQIIQKEIPSFEYVNERKCPIYVHEYSRIPTMGTYNNYPLSSRPLRKNFSIPKSRNSPSSKFMLDKLEETYWATWKPSKERNIPKNPKKPIEKKTVELTNQAHGDISDNFVHYFVTTDFNASTDSVVSENNLIASNEPVFEYGKFVEMNSQEIQTEGLPNTEILKNSAEIDNKKTDNLPKTKDDEPKSSINVINDIPEKELKDEAPTKEIGSPKIQKATSKILNHTDSFILTKKKQSEVKETYQQPKSIKLYKKSGSYVKGGTYPLKSCLKKEIPMSKGNFKLGPPGSPLFVTSNSFNRKFSK